MTQTRREHRDLLRDVGDDLSVLHDDDLDVRRLPLRLGDVELATVARDPGASRDHDPNAGGPDRAREVDLEVELEVLERDLRILSGLLASRGLDDGPGRDLARRIADTAQDLGGSLSGIIWSLDARPSTLAELASRLAEAGGNLLAAQGIAFRAEFPDAWPPDALSPRARRNLMLLGPEALHNAARHSKARSVTLGLRRDRGHWEMRIADDGKGFDPAAPHGGGHGLGTIRRRAEEIGASIDWVTQPGQGTSVVVRFSLRTIRARRSSGAFDAVRRTASDVHAASSPGRPPNRIGDGPA